MTIHDTHHRDEHVREDRSGAGPLAAVVITLLLIVFGYWAITTILESPTADDGIKIQFELPDSSTPTTGS